MESVVTDGNSAASAPATFASADWSEPAADASSASDTQDQSSTPAAAVTPPAESQGATPAAGDERSPFIPRQRFDEVNTERNTLKQWKEQFAWAEQVDRAQLEQAVKLAQRYTGDPIAFLQEIADEIKAHPEHGPKLKSYAARMLAQRGQPTAESGTDYSKIVLDLGNGQSLPLAQLVADVKAQALAEAEAKFAPVTKTVEQIRQEKEQAQAQQQFERFVSTTFEDVKTWPGMDNPDTQKKVGEALAAMSIDGNDPREVALALNAAYRKVVVPTLSSTAQSKLLDNLQRKAAASSSVNPGSAAQSAPADIKSFRDSRLTW